MDQGGFLGDARVRLLEAIATHGSITQAAKQVPLSYKAAWDAVDAMNNLAERPLVARTVGGRSGGGTQLTEHGERLVAMYRAVEREHQRALDHLAAPLHGDAPADQASFQRLLRRLAMRTSARNQFVGTVSRLREGPVEVAVGVRVDEGLEISAVVTPGSVASLGLALGSEVVALIKSSSVMLLTDPSLRLSARNQLWGTVQRISPGPVNTEVTLDLGHGRSATAVVTQEAVLALGLAEGSRACAAFKVSSVILAVLD